MPQDVTSRIQNVGHSESQNDSVSSSYHHHEQPGKRKWWKVGSMNHTTTTTAVTSPTDPGQHTAQRSSLIDRLFCWVHRTGQDRQGRTPAPAKPRQLFGAALTDVCYDDKLPTPILVGSQFRLR